VPVASVVQAHLSHAKFALPALGESCIIEPAVACNHCGFCKSYGH
jgi:predicted Zn-ribbon and HTH transcriptional regulator